MHVEDLGSRTLVTSLQTVRLLEPGQPWADAPEASEGLPNGRGRATLFVQNPLVLEVARRPQEILEKPTSDEYLWFRFDGIRWLPMEQSFGNFPLTTVPVETGTVVIAWVDESAAHRGDLAVVPAGNMTRASLIARDGSVKPWREWPEMMTWQQQATPHVVWAIADKPRKNGQFLLRLPLQGKPSLHALPGTDHCAGSDRLTNLAELRAVDDDTAEIAVWGGMDCVSKRAVGQYTFKDGRFSRHGEPEAGPDPIRSASSKVSASGAVFSLEGDTAVVTRTGSVERSPVPGMESVTTRHEHHFQVTANGREVWLLSMVWDPVSPDGTRAADGYCALHRYRWPAPPGR